jgi:hypothetical protein
MKGWRAGITGVYDQGRKVEYYLYFDTVPFVSILRFDANINDTLHDRSPIAVPV